MSLIALLLALVVERGLTHLFHLREPRWLDRYFDWAAGQLGRSRGEVRIAGSPGRGRRLRRHRPRLLGAGLAGPRGARHACRPAGLARLRPITAGSMPA